MKKTKIIVFLLAASLLSNNCLGSYSAFNNLREWNESVSNNKFVNNLLFWGLWIVPVYEIFILGDTLIFNVVEFWSGSNPIAMKDGQVETQTVVANGSTYKLTATKNKMNIAVIKGKDAGHSVEMIYNPKDQSWNAKKPNGELIKLSSMKDGFYMVYLPNGKTVKMDASTTQSAGLAKINAAYSQTRWAVK